MAPTIPDLIKEISLRAPERIGYVDPRRRVTFGELKDEVWHIADGLIRAGYRKQAVIVFMEKSVDCVAAMFGVAASGCFYTVLDTKMPPERINKILRTLTPAAAVCSESTREAAERLLGGLPLFVYEELQNAPCDDARVEERISRILPTDILYVLFTSGSTGEPKGVVTTHGAVISFIEMDSARVYKNDSHDVMLNQSPLYFVNSLPEIVTPLAWGSQVHFVPDIYYIFPMKLMEYIEQNKVTHLGWVTSALQLAVTMGVLDKADISSIDSVIFGGETMPIYVLKAWRDRLPNARFYNSYGATETTAGCLHYLVDRDFPDDAVLPVGVPDGNVEILLLDDDLHLITEPGVEGEICVRSPSLASGYYRDKERTDKAFIQNPLHNDYEEKIYRTGDLALYNDRGELEFYGRKDHQIKFMGHRIELGEIEATLMAMDEISEAACVYDKEARIITAFYTGSISEKDLGKILTKTLPDYMFPRRRVKMDALPLNLHGKVDRVRLAELAKENAAKK